MPILFFSFNPVIINIIIIIIIIIIIMINLLI